MTIRPWQADDTFVDFDAVLCKLEIDDCCSQIDQCVKVIVNRQFSEASRHTRLEMLDTEIKRLSQLAPHHSKIAEAEKLLAGITLFRSGSRWYNTYSW